jgi:hypothetical protein
MRLQDCGRGGVGLALLLGAVGCGGTTTPAGVAISVPFPDSDAQGSCNLANMVATLYIGGGHPACPLTVAADKTASGSCPEIRVGREWPLLLVYSMPTIGPELGKVALGYLLGSADLTENVLPEGDPPVVSVNMQVTADTWVKDEFNFGRWQPAVACAGYSPSLTLTARDMQGWAWCYVSDTQTGLHTFLDCNDTPSPVSALVRLCGGSGLTTCTRP